MRRPLMAGHARRILGAGLTAVVAGGLAALSTLIWTAPAAADTAGPAVVAWWNLQNQGTVAPPTPAGVNPGDLFVEGVGGDKQAPAEPPAPFPSGIGGRGAADAIAGLTFPLAQGTKVDRLTLKFDGSAPVMSSVEACRATAPFGPNANGPWSDVPPYDCTATAVGTVSPDGKALVFADIGALVHNGTLSVVLIPQFYDREVWTKPGADAITITPPPPSFDTSAPAASTFDPSAGLGSAFGGGTAAAPLPAFSSAPSTIAPAQPAVPNGAARTAVAASGGAVDPNRARIVAAIALVTTLLIFAFLMGANSTILRRLFGARVAATAAGRTGGARGVGRFKRDRTGRPDAV